MPIGGDQIIAGQYTVTWNAVALGIHLGDDNVPTIRATPRADPIDNTDRYGRTKVDSVQMGYTYRYESVCLEYPKAILAFSPWGPFGTIGVPGTLKYSMAKPLVLTVVANGTSAVGNPTSLTAPKAMLADDFDARIKFGPQVRTVPLQMDLYPASIDATTFVITCFTIV